MKKRLRRYGAVLLLLGGVIVVSGMLRARSAEFFVDLEAHDVENMRLAWERSEEHFYYVKASHSLTGGQWQLIGILPGWTGASWEDISAFAAECAEGYIRVLRIHRNSLRDYDGDGIPDAWELLHGLNPRNHLDALEDWDNDGLSNLDEHFYNLDPNDPSDGMAPRPVVFEPAQIESSALFNRNWLFYNNTEQTSPTWERLPGDWRPFLLVDEALQTNVLQILLPREISQIKGATTDTRLHVAWPDENAGEWLAAEYPGVWLTSLVLSAENPFHGLPESGVQTVDVHRFEWPWPPMGEDEVCWIAPIVRVTGPGLEVEQTVLARKNPDVAELMRNNWKDGPQHLFDGGNPAEVDYPVRLARQRLRNGDFEQGEPAHAAELPHWNLWGANAGISTNIALETGGRSFYSSGWDGVLFQNIAVYPGEEIVLSGYILTPSTNNPHDPNPLTEAKRGKAALEFYAFSGARVTSGSRGELTGRDLRETWITGHAEHDLWHHFAITSLVPDRAWSANIALRADLVGEGRAYFDGLQIAVSPDSDHDGIPDHWELLHGLDPHNPLDALSTPANDGLTALDKYRLGLDPNTDDTDGDGIPDHWELLHGLDPLAPHDAHEDPDNDGLTNLEEYLHGTDPDRADTDGDGLSDFEEIHDFLTDPIEPDLMNRTLVTTLDAGQLVNSLGEWKIENTEMLAESRRGALEFEVETTRNDLYLLEIVGADGAGIVNSNLYPLHIEINDVPVARLFLPTYALNEVSVHCLTPWLPAGTHRIRVIWDGFEEFWRLRVNELRLWSIPGEDTTGDGHKDWITRRLQRQCRLDETPLSSLVSPLCLEGTAEFAELLTNSAAAQIRRGIGNRFFADIPLGDGPVETVFTFQSGAITLTNRCEWIPIDLLTASNMNLRAGDALRLTVQPASPVIGEIQIQVGETGFQHAEGWHTEYRFETPGEYLVTAAAQTHDGPVSGMITVSVVRATFNGSPACWAGYAGFARPWHNPGIPPDIHVDFDPRIRVWENPAAEGRSFDLKLDDNIVCHATARLYPGGPLLDSAPIRGFILRTSTETYLLREDVLPDGTDVIGALFIVSPLYPDLWFDCAIHVSGVTFEDEQLHQVYLPDDFDELGQRHIRFHQTPDAQTSACFQFRAWQNDTQLGAK